MGSAASLPKRQVAPETTAATKSGKDVKDTANTKEKGMTAPKAGKDVKDAKDPKAGSVARVASHKATSTPPHASPLPIKKADTKSMSSMENILDSAITSIYRFAAHDENDANSGSRIGLGGKESTFVVKVDEKVVKFSVRYEGHAHEVRCVTSLDRILSRDVPALIELTNKAAPPAHASSFYLLLLVQRYLLSRINTTTLTEWSVREDETWIQKDTGFDIEGALDALGDMDDATSLKNALSIADTSAPSAPRQRSYSLAGARMSITGSSNSLIAPSVATGPQSTVPLVAVIGSLNADLMAKQSPDQLMPTENKSQPAAHFQVSAGGKGANEAVSVSRLGVRTALIGVIGGVILPNGVVRPDEFGKFLLRELRDQPSNISTDSIDVVTSEADGKTAVATGVSLIVINPHLRKNITVPCAGANRTVGQKQLETVSRVVAAGARFVVMQNEIPHDVNLRAAVIARSRGATSVLRGYPVLAPNPQSPVDLLADIGTFDVAIFLSFEIDNMIKDSRELAKAAAAASSSSSPSAAAADLPAIPNTQPGLSGYLVAARYMVSRGCKCVVIHHLAIGLLCYDQNGPFLVPNVEREANVVPEFIGAVDALIGGIVAGLTKFGDGPDSFRRSVVWGAALSTKVTEGPGPWFLPKNYDDFLIILKTKKLDECAIRGEASKDTMGNEAAALIFGAKVDEIRAVLAKKGPLAEKLTKGKDWQGQTALHLAIMCGLDKVTAQLLKANADPFARDRYGQDCHGRLKLLGPTSKPEMAEIAAQLELVVEFSKWTVGESTSAALIPRLCSVRDNELVSSIVASCVATGNLDGLLPKAHELPEERSILHSAAKNNNAELLRMLLKLPEMKTNKLKVRLPKSGDTPLHVAVRNSHYEAAKIIIESSVEHLGLKNEQGKTPMDIAIEMDKPENANFLFNLQGLAKRSDVFISYGHVDGEKGDTEFATWLKAQLEANHINVWMDTRRIGEGNDWRKDIEDGLNNTKILLFLVSQKSLKSKYCTNEFQFAQKHQLHIIPILPQDKLRADLRAGVMEAQEKHSYLNTRQYFQFALDATVSQEMDRLRQAGNDADAKKKEEEFWATRIQDLVKQVRKARREKQNDLYAVSQARRDQIERALKADYDFVPDVYLYFPVGVAETNGKRIASAKPSPTADGDDVDVTDLYTHDDAVIDFILETTNLLKAKGITNVATGTYGDPAQSTPVNLRDPMIEKSKCLIVVVTQESLRQASQPVKQAIVVSENPPSGKSIPILPVMFAHGSLPHGMNYHLGNLQQPVFGFTNLGRGAAISDKPEFVWAFERLFRGISLAHEADGDHTKMLELTVNSDLMNVKTNPEFARVYWRYFQTSAKGTDGEMVVVEDDKGSLKASATAAQSVVQQLASDDKGKTPSSSSSVSTALVPALPSIVHEQYGLKITVTGESWMTPDQLRTGLECKAMKEWFRRGGLQLGLLRKPFVLRGIHVQSLDMFGSRVGFLKFKTDLIDGGACPVPGIVFARGDSVAILVLLKARETGCVYTVLTMQPRVPTCQRILELPAGMINDKTGDFAGVAAEEMREETGISIGQNDLFDLTALMNGAAEPHIFPSGGGCDEAMRFFLYRTTLDVAEIGKLQGKMTGVWAENEKIRLHVLPYEEVWRKTMDAKVLCAVALYERGSAAGLIPNMS